MTDPDVGNFELPNLLFPPVNWSLRLSIDHDQSQDHLQLGTTIATAGGELQAMQTINIPLINDLDENVKLFIEQIYPQIRACLGEYAELHKTPF